METKVFVDTNILLYIVDHDELKTPQALRLLDERPAISVQVANEFVNISRRKFKLSWEQIRDALEYINDSCRIFPVTLPIHERALDIAEAALLNIYDACIVAAAEISGCDVLLTEDLNHGQRIGGITVRNPFA